MTLGDEEGEEGEERRKRELNWLLRKDEEGEREDGRQGGGRRARCKKLWTYEARRMSGKQKTESGTSKKEINL